MSHSGFEAVKTGKIDIYRQKIPASEYEKFYVRHPDSDITSNYSVGNPKLQCGENDEHNTQKAYVIWHEKNDHILYHPGEILPHQYQLTNYIDGMNFPSEQDFLDAMGCPMAGQDLNSRRNAQKCLVSTNA